MARLGSGNTQTSACSGTGDPLFHMALSMPVSDSLNNTPRKLPVESALTRTYVVVRAGEPWTRRYLSMDAGVRSPATGRFPAFFNQNSQNRKLSLRVRRGGHSKQASDPHMFFLLVNHFPTSLHQIQQLVLRFHSFSRVNFTQGMGRET